MRRSAGVLFSGSLVISFVLILSSGCTSTVKPSPAPVQSTPPPGTGDNLSWMDMPLSDLQGKGNFSISSFAGRPLLLPVLSDACPSCILQLSWQIREIERLDGVQDKSITVIALDIDPPGDPGFISKYRDQFSFSGYTARLPDDRILELLRTFGVFAVDTNTNPVILICPGGNAVLLPPGPKDTGSLETLMIEEC